MHKATTAILVATTLLAGGVRAVSAQSLADIARKEEERRKELKGGKTYTNKDLSAVPPPSALPPPTATASPASSTSTSDSSAAKPKDSAAKDQAYWSGRMKQLVTQLDRDKTYADAMQSRVNALNTDFVNRDDPAQRSMIETDRQKALAELDRLKNSVAEAQKAIAELEDEARRANVPPGWLR